MTPELVAVAEARKVTRIHSVGVTMPLGTMALEELVTVGVNLINRQFAYPPITERQYAQLQADYEPVATEIRLRKTGVAS